MICVCATDPRRQLLQPWAQGQEGVVTDPGWPEDWGFPAATKQDKGRERLTESGADTVGRGLRWGMGPVVQDQFWKWGSGLRGMSAGFHVHRPPPGP